MAYLPVVLMVTHGLGLEGAPRAFVNLAKGILASHSYVPIVVSHVDGPLRVELEDTGIKVFVLPKVETPLQQPSNITQLDSYVLENLGFLREFTGSSWDETLDMLVKYIIRFQPDIIFGNTVLAFWAMAVAQHMGVPSVWAIHESEEPFVHLQCLDSQIRDQLPNILQSASRVIFVAAATAEVFLSVGDGRNFTVIHNGLFPESPVFEAEQLSKEKCRDNLGIPPCDVSLLMVASVFERKGQLDLCRAMSHLPADVYTKVRCDFVGDRPGTEYSRELHRYVDALPANIRTRIRIFQETKEVAAHYRAADVFVLCSRMESYPFVILEAMMMGLPIITTPVFGIREQLDDTCALFYEPGDIDKLATHLMCVVRNRDLRFYLGSAAKSRYEMLPSFNQMVTEYIKVFNSVQKLI